MKPLRALKAAVAAAGAYLQMRFSRTRPYWGLNLGATTQTFARSVGDPSTNDVVLACIRWMQRTFPEAKLTVRTTTQGAEEPTAVPDHPLSLLLAKPNPYYSGLLLWSATIADFALSGNAYWLKVRSGAGAPVELWWVPSDSIEPAWDDADPTVYIAQYTYTVNDQQLALRPEDVVHFRNGLDPRNVRKGRSDIAALMRELATDNEAANWTASMLRNMGVPGVVISPTQGGEITEDDGDGIKEQYSTRFSGDHRGEPLVLSGSVDVKTLSFSPQQMELREVRKVPEERVSALFGIPAIVVGLGAGLDRSTFSNFAEARQAAYESNIIPTQRLFAAELNTQLVPDFGDPRRLFVEWDYSDVRILQDDLNDLHERARADLLAGLITRNQALAMIHEKADETPGGDALYVPNTVTPMAPEDVLGLRRAPVRETLTETAPPALLPPTPPAPGTTPKALAGDELQKRVRSGRIARWVLGSGGASGTHCPQCEELAALGWVPTEEFSGQRPGDGSTYCGSACTCDFQEELPGYQEVIWPGQGPRARTTNGAH